MLEFQTTALLEFINLRLLGSVLSNMQVRVWSVFILCLLFSAAGAFLSFWLLGTVIKDTRLWGFGLVIAVIMLGYLPAQLLRDGAYDSLSLAVR
jgi:hypothetical protein